MKDRTVVLGVTGSTGSGKSTLCGYLAEWGASVIDADAVARQLQQPGAPGYQGILKAFGEGYCLPDGALDRKKLAAEVFSCKASLNRLNAVMHPMILDAIVQWTSRQRGVAVIDAPLLFETGLDALCDAVWVIRAPLETRLARVIKRDGLTRKQAMDRINSQREIPHDRAILVLENTGDPAALAQKARPYFDRLLKE